MSRRPMAYREPQNHPALPERFPDLYGSVEDRRAAFLAMLEEGIHPMIPDDRKDEDA